MAITLGICCWSGWVGCFLDAFGDLTPWREREATSFPSFWMTLPAAKMLSVWATRLLSYSKNHSNWAIRQYGLAPAWELRSSRKMQPMLRVFAFWLTFGCTLTSIEQGFLLRLLAPPCRPHHSLRSRYRPAHSKL